MKIKQMIVVLVMAMLCMSFLQPTVACAGKVTGTTPALFAEAEKAYQAGNIDRALEYLSIILMREYSHQKAREYFHRIMNNEPFPCILEKSGVTRTSWGRNFSVYEDLLKVLERPRAANVASIVSIARVEKAAQPEVVLPAQSMQADIAYAKVPVSKKETVTIDASPLVVTVPAKSGCEQRLLQDRAGCGDLHAQFIRKQVEYDNAIAAMESYVYVRSHDLGVLQDALIMKDADIAIRDDILLARAAEVTRLMDMVRQYQAQIDTRGERIQR